LRLATAGISHYQKSTTILVILDSSRYYQVDTEQVLADSGIRKLIQVPKPTL